MQITINDHRKIFAIQEEFNTLFPNLKIEFYAKPSHADGSHPKKLVDAKGKTLAECRNTHNTGQLTITQNMTIADLENSFTEVYGLDVEVFKRSGSGWTGTAEKNKLSLEEQNKNQ